MISERYSNGDAKMPTSGCPVCFKRLDAATDTTGEDAIPKPGDITICLGCTAVLEFDKSLMPKRLTAATKASMSKLELRRILASVRMVEHFHADMKAKRG